MAITKTQIARQLYQAGGGADFGAPDKAKDRATKGYGNVGGGKAASKGFKQDAKPGEQSPQVYGASGKQYDPAAAKAAAIAQGRFKKKDSIRKFAEGYTKNTRKFLYNTFPNNPSNELDYLKQLPAAQRALLSPALKAKLEALELDEDQDLLGTAKTKFTFDEFEELKNFQPTEGLNFAEYAAKFKGAPGLLYSGDVGNLIKTRNPDGTFSYRRDFSQDDPSTMESDLEARLRLLEEQRKKVEEPVAKNPLADLFARLMADGGRVGIMNGGRIGFKGGADMATVAGDTTPARKGSVNISSSGGVTFDPSGRDDGPESNLADTTTKKQLLDMATTGAKNFAINQAIEKSGIGAKLGKLLSLDPRLAAILGIIGAGKGSGVGDQSMLNEEDVGGLPESNLLAFEPGSIKDKQLKQMYNIFEETGMQDPRMKGLMQEDIKEGGPLSLPEEAYQTAAEGGRIGAMEGGIMDLETGRQMYFLGKLVKKATRAVKKIVKSPIGKAALLGGAAYFGGPKLASFFGKGSFNPFLKKVAGDTAFSGLGSILNKAGLVNLSGGLTGGGMLALGGALTAAPLLFGKQEDDDDTIDPALLGPRIDIARLLANPYQATLGTGFRRTAADGGRIGYQEGSKEPVAKKTMPLLDMGGQEMDLRDNGGFVPIGRMEKADDVPARLSKNEFVFTADAVRNAGDGDIDKGAEVMYNMMKNLEDGGNVSEESQGLEGARKMFQTAQRLEEVL